MLEKLKRVFQREPKHTRAYLFPSHLSALEKIGRFVGKTPAKLVTEGLGIYIESKGIEQGHQGSRVLR